MVLPAPGRSVQLRPQRTGSSPVPLRRAVQARARCGEAAAAAVAVALSGLVDAAPTWALPPQQLEEIRAAIVQDFTQGQYYVTGRLDASKRYFDPGCRFSDPTTDVQGIHKASAGVGVLFQAKAAPCPRDSFSSCLCVQYTAAVAALFDPDASRADLIDSSVVGPHSIQLRWRLEGRLKLLGGLAIKPYTGTTLYELDEGSGLVTKHVEAWDISAADAFLSTLIPGFGAPPAPPV